MGQANKPAAQSNCVGSGNLPILALVAVDNRFGDVRMNHHTQGRQTFDRDPNLHSHPGRGDEFAPSRYDRRWLAAPAALPVLVPVNLRTAYLQLAAIGTKDSGVTADLPNRAA
jgi:hypothetical protein